MNPERHDWQRIIKEIRAGYLAERGTELSDYKLGLLIGLDERAIDRLANTPDAQPRHYEGEKLLQLRATYSAPHFAGQGAARDGLPGAGNGLT